MTRQELIDLATNSIKNFSTNFYSSLADWLDEGQIDIVRRTGCYTATKSLVSVDGTREYELGTDVMRLLFVTYDSKEVQPTTMEQMQFYADYPAESAEGTPTHYYVKMLNNPLMGFTPIPDTSDKVISVHYIRRPPSLTTPANDPVIPEQYQRLIVKFAMYNLLIKDVKVDTLSLWQREYEQGVNRMAEETANFDKRRRKSLVPYGNEHRGKSMKAYTRA